MSMRQPEQQLPEHKRVIELHQEFFKTIQSGIEDIDYEKLEEILTNPSLIISATSSSEQVAAWANKISKTFQDEIIEEEFVKYLKASDATSIMTTVQSILLTALQDQKEAAERIREPVPEHVPASPSEQLRTIQSSLASKQESLETSELTHAPIQFSQEKTKTAEISCPATQETFNKICGLIEESMSTAENEVTTTKSGNELKIFDPKDAPSTVKFQNGTITFSFPPEPEKMKRPLEASVKALKDNNLLPLIKGSDYKLLTCMAEECVRQGVKPNFSEIASKTLSNKGFNPPEKFLEEIQNRLKPEKQKPKPEQHSPP